MPGPALCVFLEDTISGTPVRPTLRRVKGGIKEAFAFPAYEGDPEGAAAGLGGEDRAKVSQCHLPSSQLPSAWAFPPGTFPLLSKTIIRPAAAAALWPRKKGSKEVLAFGFL